MLVQRLAFAALLLAICWVPSQGALAEARIALVIGNSEYGPAIGKLKNPANDARLMADTLSSLGFKVDLVLDADQKAMKRAVKGFGVKLREAGSGATGLFYYAGHGVQVDGTNFLLPVGAEIGVEADVEIESISADDVMTQMQSAGNAVNLVFLDACRNNPLAASSRSATRGLARLDAPRGSFVGYSTAPGDVAADGDGANSPYALALAEELRNPGISIEEAHRNVRARVLAASGNTQMPWDSSSLTGPVVLAAKAAQPAPQPAAQSAPQPQEQAAVNMEVVFWESIKGSTDPADFDAYLAQYPQGAFVPLARNKIAALKNAPAQPSTGTEPAGATESSTGQPPKRIVVSSQLQQEIASYLEKAAAQHRWGALAVATDGGRIGTAFCNKDGVKTQICIDGVRNNPTTQAQTNKAAISDCGGVGKCVLLYEGTVKRSTVEIVSQTSAAAPVAEAAPQPQPEPTQQAAAAPSVDLASPESTSSKLVVTSEIKDKIEKYLRNAGGSGRYFALAIAKNGSQVTSLTCDKTSYDSKPGCGGWALNQQQVNDGAVRNCGGFDACMLLYSGTSKAASVEIATQ